MNYVQSECEQNKILFCHCYYTLIFYDFNIGSRIYWLCDREKNDIFKISVLVYIS